MHRATPFSPGAVLSVAVLLAVGSGPAGTIEARSEERSYLVDLDQAKVSALPDGTWVVTLEARGDLRGLLTLKLTPTGDGGAAGDWALLVAHVQDLHHDGTPAHEPPHDGERGGPDHHEHIALVNRGTLGGTVTAATLAFGPGGALDGIQDATLELHSGSLEYEGVTGEGTTDAQGVGDTTTSRGTLRITARR